MGVAASSLALLDAEGMLEPYAPLNLDAIMREYRDKKNPPAWCRHGRLGRDGLLQHGGGAEEEHPEARDLEGPDQARLQGPGRDAQPGVVGHRLLRRDRLAARCGATHGRAAAGSTWTRLHENIAQYTHSGPSPATWRPPANSWSASRSNTAPTATRPRARRSTWCSRRKAWAGTSRRSRIHKGTKKIDAAKKLADWASSKDAMMLYGKNFAITAQPGVAAPLANVPGDYEKRLVKMDFNDAAEEPRAHPGRVDQALQRQIRAEEIDDDPGAPVGRCPQGGTPRPWSGPVGVRAPFAITSAWKASARSSAPSPRCTTSTSRSRKASSSASSAPRAAARPRCCASSPGSKRRPRAHRPGRARHLGAAAGPARLRHRVPVLRAVPQPHGRGQRRLWTGQPQGATRRDRRASRSC